MVKNKKNIRIKTSPEGIHQLEAFIEDICYEYNIMNTYYGNIQLALNEAFFNATVHGNRNDPDTFVDVSFFSDQKGLHFLVSDQGEGFDYSNFTNQDPLELPENDDQDKRGILVIKMLADEVNFLNEGCTIELVFYISSINYSMTLERKRHLESYFKSVAFYKTS